MKAEEIFKVVASFIAVVTAIIGLFTNIDSCHKKEPQIATLPIKTQLDQPTAVEQPLNNKEQPVALKEQPSSPQLSQATEPSPAVLGYLDQKGGFRLHPESVLSGSQTVGSQITDDTTLVKIALKNSILIEEFQNKYSAMLKFEREANKENLQAVVDWTSFIASYRQLLEQKVSTNPDIKKALHHIDNLDNYRKELNELE
jgi:hypothetical protein